MDQETTRLMVELDQMTAEMRDHLLLQVSRLSVPQTVGRMVKEAVSANRQLSAAGTWDDEKLYHVFRTTCALIGYTALIQQAVATRSE